MKSAWIFNLLLIFYIIFFFPVITFAQNKTFAKIQFGNEIYIEIPKNWSYLNKDIRQHINTGSEAICTLAGVPVSQGNNQIVLAANAYTNYKAPSATLRLSVRRGQTLTQTDVQELANESKSEIDSFTKPILDQTASALRSMDGVKSVRSLGIRIEKNKYISCIFTEFELSKREGTVLSQTWICPTGDKTIKLSSSYRKNETALFKPIIHYVWQSLYAK